MRRMGISTGAVVLLLLAYSAGAASAGTLPVRICGPSGLAPGNIYTGDPGEGLSSTSGPGVSATPSCPSTGTSPGLQLYAGGGAPRNATAAFKVTAPQGIVINGIHVVGAYSSGVDDGRGWSGWFYWNGGPGPAGNAGTNSLTDTNNAFYNYGCCSQGGLNSQSVGWFMVCRFTSCSSPGGVNVGELDLTAEEDHGPLMIPTGHPSLWIQPGWMRGRWDASIVASDPSGVCGAFVTLGSLPAATVAHPTLPVRSRWQQCPEQGVSTVVDTSISQGSLGLGVGTMSLSAGADNAAAVHSGSTKTVYVDDSAPTVSLSGPTDAPSTAGTQYATATGVAGPSGVADILCTVDGGPQLRFAGASAQVPVAGIGQHTVSCRSENNAVDPAGNHGISAPASAGLKIGEPTLVGISFSKLVGLNCHRVRKRVRVGGHLVTVRRHGKLVKIHKGGRTKLVKVTRCHPRTVRRRTVVFVIVRHHGRLVKVKRTRLVRVVVAPHLLAKSSKRVAFGHRTTVSGWLGTSAGAPLGGRTVRVISAPDNHLAGQFTQAAAVSTSADGTWTARLPAGPSRLVEATYDGSSDTEAGSSGQVRVVVPAKMKLLSVSPRRVAWGGTVRITGQLLGGYLPPGGALVRLRIGLGRNNTTYGVKTHVGGNGRFSTLYTFGVGYPGIYRSYSFQLATLPMGSYPYAPAASDRRAVLVGGHPAIIIPSPPHHVKHRHYRGKRRRKA